MDQLKKITFKRQILDCVVFMALGFILADVFHKPIIWQAFLIICGEMFIVNPVYPKGIKYGRMPTVMRVFGLALVVLAVVLYYVFK